MTHLIPYQPFRQQPENFSRLKYYKLCDALAAALMLPPSNVALIAKAVTEAVKDSSRLPVLWLSFQDCTGDKGAFFRSGEMANSGRPQIADSPILNLLSDLISLDYRGRQALQSNPASQLPPYQAMHKRSGATICILEGSLPLKSNGYGRSAGGQSSWTKFQQTLLQARAVIALESANGDGNGAAGPSRTTSVRAALPGLKNLICLPGRPAAIFDVVASLVYLITFDHLPPVDSRQRPYFS